MSTVAVAAVSQSVDRENPWPGLSTFTEEQSAFFFGRDEEVRELLRRVERKALTVLFGQSGLGKSSLLQAGVFPRLREENFCPIYVRLDHSASAPPLTEQIKTFVFRETARAGTWTHGGVPGRGESLWEFFHHREDRLLDGDGNVVIPVLVFDQFEELFTLGAAADPETRRRATGFIAELADLVENRPPANLEARLEESSAEMEAFDFSRADYRVLITLREDYLPHLESQKTLMPSLMQNRMRLTRMQAARALEAVMKPGEDLVTEDVAREIVAFVSGHSEMNEADVEPSLLSLVCRELNNQRRARGEPVISTVLLAGTRETILREFYERTLADQPPAVWHFVEDELLTESGYRENIALERARKHLAEAGADPKAIDVLVNRRLLRIEERLDVRRVELTHDVLCNVVKASRTVRHEREALEKTKRELSEQQAKEKAARHALNRARKVAAVCIILMVIAIGNAVFGVISLRRAQAAETRAESVQRLAERARGEAEKLVGFLLDDFYEELEPTGRLDTVGRLAQQAVSYYDGLPVELLSAQTLRYRGMALVRQGVAMMAHGNVSAAEPVLKKARGVFEKLQAEGDTSEETAIGLALALGAHTSGVVSDTASLVDLQRAVELLRPRATAANASKRVRRIYADALNALSHTQSKETAIATCEEARKILTGLGALELDDLGAASAYGDLADTEARHALALGKLDDAEKLEREAMDLAERVLARRPGDLRSMLNRCLAPDILAAIAERRADFPGAMNLAKKADESAEDYVRFNPSNAYGWQMWAAAKNRMANCFLAQGRVNDALVQARAAAALEHDPRNSSGTHETFFRAWALMAVTEAQLGHRSAADEAVGECRRIAAALAKQMRAGLSLTTLMAENVRLTNNRVRMAFDENEAALTDLLSSVARIEKVPTDDKLILPMRSEIYRDALESTLIAAFRLRLAADTAKAADALVADSLVDLAPDQAEDVNSWYRVLQSVALLMQGKRAEAVPVLEPAMKHFREQQGKGNTPASFLQKFARAFSSGSEKKPLTTSVTAARRFAFALYVHALTQADDSSGRSVRRNELDEALAVMNSLPDEAKQLHDSREVSTMITEARSKPSGA